MTIRLAIATPTLDGRASIEYTASILQLQGRLQARGIRTYFLYFANESMIHVARNKLVTAFLAHPDQLTHLLFVDSDLAFDPEGILRMLDSNKDLIGGVYSKKKIDWAYIADLARCHEAIRVADYPTHANNYDIVFYPLDRTARLTIDVPQAAAHVGTGLMLVKRTVFEAMMAHYPTDWYYQMEDRYFRFFDFGTLPDGQLISEDYWFCKRWRDMGNEVYAALWTITRHFGTYGYPCDLNMVCATGNNV